MAENEWVTQVINPIRSISGVISPHLELFLLGPPKVRSLFLVVLVGPQISKMLVLWSGSWQTRKFTMDSQAHISSFGKQKYEDSVRLRRACTTKFLSPSTKLLLGVFLKIFFVSTPTWGNDPI